MKKLVSLLFFLFLTYTLAFCVEKKITQKIKKESTNAEIVNIEKGKDDLEVEIRHKGEKKQTFQINYLSEFEEYKNLPYDFSHPTQTFEMPIMLKEISGISYIGNSQLVCVQDELGVLFLLDCSNKKVLDFFRFTDVGDFEDIATNQDTAYILRSDGSIFSFNYKNFEGKVNHTNTSVKCLDSEGLFYNKQDNSLLIACKSNDFNSGDTIRNIYKTFTNKLFDANIELQINIKEIRKMLYEKYNVDKLENIQLNPSAIAIHPISKETYILSAEDRLIAIYKNNKLKNIIPLPSKIYHKPEGIDFNESGDLYLSSEGIKKGSLNGMIYFLKKK
jgi:hypothetical protein